MKIMHLILRFAGVLSLIAAPPVLVAQPPGDEAAEVYEEEFSERAGVDEEDDLEAGVVEPEYDSDADFPGVPFDYAEREYSELDEYDTGYYDYDPYFDDDNGYAGFYTDDWFSDESAFDAWYDGE